jgi:2-polyprenyl-3-methyl-5-hydroxy-6-metoxy-1,4-benzoquinol methylase
VSGTAWRHPTERDPRPLTFEPVACCLCGAAGSEPVATGEDFEYRTSPDSFLAVRCARCDLVYLDPRPVELDRIYPDSYHAFAFSSEGFGLVHRVRERLEARRLLSVCRGLPKGARILDVGCGDGFHLALLEKFGDRSWVVEGVDIDARAVAAARARGLTAHEGTIESLAGTAEPYHVAFMIQTVEHVADPPAVLAATRAALRPGGRVVVVTDNTGSPDFRLARGRHWGGYHFPRHLTLFSARSIGLLAEKAGLEVERVETIVSPVNWVYSVRNRLDDWHAPRWLVEQFSLTTPLTLAFFTLVDMAMARAGRGALLRAVLRRPS